MNTRPRPPHTMYAARQPKETVMAAVAMGERSQPEFPPMPLMPRALPRCLGPKTFEMYERPTGW